jgi:DNA-binding MarR family transcriptional regulator
MKNKEELVDEVLGLFKRLGHNRMRYQREPWQRLTVPLAQLKSLFLIKMKDSMNVRDLASDLGVTPGNVTSIIDRLVGQGLVERRESPDDRRIVLMQLTEKGQKIITEIHETEHTSLKRFLDKMSAEDIEALYRGLNGFLTAMEQDWKESEIIKTGGFSKTESDAGDIHHHHIINL